MAIKVIVELQAKPGRRAELSSLLERIIANEGPSQPGFRGSTRYEVLENPDVLVEIADWESAEARDVHMQQAAATGALCTAGRSAGCSGPATVISRLP